MMHNRLTLLYVEDDIETLQDISFLLKDYFSEIFTAQDGVEAINKFIKQKPNIVLLDMNIPKKNGIEVATKIRKLNKETPILFLTAYSDRERLMEVIKIGVSAYIVKPLKIEELKDAIDRVILKEIDSTTIKLAYNFFWDKTNNKLIYRSDELSLTKNEFKLLDFLYKNRQQFFLPCKIATEIFPQNINDNRCNNIVQLISRFKNKVSNSFQTEDFFIQNVYGVGYKLL